MHIRTGSDTGAPLVDRDDVRVGDVIMMNSRGRHGTALVTKVGRTNLTGSYVTVGGLKNARPYGDNRGVFVTNKVTKITDCWKADPAQVWGNFSMPLDEQLPEQVRRTLENPWVSLTVNYQDEWDNYRFNDYGWSFVRTPNGEETAYKHDEIPEGSTVLIGPGKYQDPFTSGDFEDFRRKVTLPVFDSMMREIFG